MDGTDLQQQHYLYIYHTAHILGMITDHTGTCTYLIFFLMNGISVIVCLLIRNGLTCS